MATQRLAVGAAAWERGVPIQKILMDKKNNGWFNRYAVSGRPHVSELSSSERWDAFLAKIVNMWLHWMIESAVRPFLNFALSRNGGPRYHFSSGPLTFQRSPLLKGGGLR